MPRRSISAGLIWDLPDLLLPELDPLEDEPEDLAGEAEPPLRFGLPFEPLWAAGDPPRVAGDPPLRWLNLHSLPNLHVPALKYLQVTLPLSLSLLGLRPLSPPPRAPADFDRSGRPFFLPYLLGTPGAATSLVRLLDCSVLLYSSRVRVRKDFAES